MTWFNEIDPIACAVLRRCYDGVVCERSIKDVRPGDLDDYHSRRHWFAGAGLWEVACRLAGWPAERELWTVSCPCQGESVAGKRLGALDPRDLWPDFFALVRTQRPACVVGEQVDAAVGTHWLDRAAADMENAGYAFRAIDIPACAVDAPHRRNRIYWCAVGDADAQRRLQPQGGVGTLGRWRGDADARGAVEHAKSERWGEGRPEYELRGGRNAAAITDGARAVAGCDRPLTRGQDAPRARQLPVHEPDAQHVSLAVADADGGRRDGRAQDALGLAIRRDAAEWPSFWSDAAEWLRCADGKARRSKPGIRLLVDGLAGRADLWRLAGNSIIPQLAAQVLAALMDVT